MSRECGLDHFMYINAGRVFRNAVEACFELSSPDLTSSLIQRNALTSIVFATVSAEAFINELHHTACIWASRPESPEWTKALCEILGEAEKSRSSIESKYQLAKFILSGRAFDKGAAPFQNFALLVDVRNLIVHAKPLDAIVGKDEHGKVVWTEPKVMVRLQEIGVAKVDDNLREIASKQQSSQIITDLVAQISTRDTASWACKSSSALVNAILDVVPKGFAKETDFAYRKDFTFEQQEPRKHGLRWISFPSDSTTVLP